MAKKQSKSEQLVWKNAAILYDVVEELNLGVNYVFIGAFANLAHNHFRGNALFEILVLESDFYVLSNIMKSKGFKHKKCALLDEFFTSDLVIKVQVSTDISDFDFKLLLNLLSFNKEYNMYFPSLSVHKKYLEKSGDFYLKEDIKLLNNQDLQSNVSRRGSLFEQYICNLYMNKKHNHIDGSSSCDLCSKKGDV